jgi:hypothetical protein
VNTLLVIGGILTTYAAWRVGRWCAEFGRAKHDMHKAWNHRKNYRDD